jgi:Galactose-3-O-sulfotransferase
VTRAKSDPRRCTVFLHIPKTGGVTLRGALRHKYPGRVITLHSPREPARVGDLPVEQRRAARVLTGHLPYGVDRYMPQECEYVTMLREPVARVVSTYHHVLDHPRHWFHDEVVSNEMGLEDFVAASDGPADNLQTRLLSGLVEGELVTRTARSVEVTTLGVRALDEARANLDRFLVVGLTERFDESFILVRRGLGWRLPMYAIRNAARGSRRARPGSRETALIAERDRLDVELYEHAQGLLASAIEREGASFPREVAAFRLLNRIPNAVGPRVPAPLRNPVRSLRARGRAARRPLARQEPPAAGR